MAKQRVPGSYKNNASFEADTLRNKSRADRAFNDVKVEDEEYSYTGPEWPGHMDIDLNLNRAERARVIHK